MATAISAFYGDIFPEVGGCPTPRVDVALIDTLREFCAYTKIWKERLTPISTMALEDATDIAFVDASPCTITSTSSNFTTTGFAATDEIVTNQGSNDDDKNSNTGPYTLAIVAANTLTLASTDSVADVDAGTNTYIAKSAYALSHASGDIVEIEKPIYFDKEPVEERDIPWLNFNCPRWRYEMGSSPMFYNADIQSKLLRLIPICDQAIENAIEVWVYLKPSKTATTIEDFIVSEYQQAISCGAMARLQKMKGTSWYDPKQAQLNYSLYDAAKAQAWRKARAGLTNFCGGMEA